MDFYHYDNLTHWRGVSNDRGWLSFFILLFLEVKEHR
jgi:hypothetical protein